MKEITRHVKRKHAQDKTLKQARGTKPDNIERYIAPHLEHLYKRAYRFTDSAADAEDLMQDFLANICAKREDLKKIENLGGWLDRCLYHCFIDQYRKRERQPNLVDIEELTPLEEPVIEDQHEYLHLEKKIMDSLKNLSDEQRLVTHLHDIEGYTLAEISEQLGKPVGTLKSQLHRARNKIKEHI